MLSHASQRVIRLMIGGQSLLGNGLSDCDDDGKVDDNDIVDRDGGDL